MLPPPIFQTNKGLKGFIMNDKQQENRNDSIYITDADLCQNETGNEPTTTEQQSIKVSKTTSLLCRNTLTQLFSPVSFQLFSHVSEYLCELV